MLSIADLLVHDETIVRNAAFKIKELIDSDITKDELEELTNDILELIIVENAVADVERKILLEKAYKALKFIVTTAISAL